MLVESDKFSLCMLVWRMKQWLVPPSEEHSYPLPCRGYTDGYTDCVCKHLLQVMWTDDTLKSGTMQSEF